MAKYDEGELISWIEDERKRRFIWLLAFMLAVAGIVLASLLAPIILSHLVLAGIAYPAAFLITTLAAIALIVSIMRFLSLNFLYSDFVKIFSKTNKKRWDKWYLAASIIGLVLGIALCTFVGPVIINSLMLVGASHAFAVFITILAGLILLKLTIDALLLPNLIKKALKKAQKLREDKSWPWLGKFILTARIVGVGLGIYLSALVFPLITAALTSALVPHAVAILTAIGLSVGLVGACHSLLSKAAWLLADFVYLFSQVGKDESIIDSTSDDPTKPVSAASFIKKFIETELPRKYEDGAALSDALISYAQLTKDINM